MKKSDQAAASMTMERLQELRAITDQVSKYLLRKTQSYLGAIRASLAPHRILGRYIEHPGNTSVKGADKVWARLCTAYSSVVKNPFSIPAELPERLWPIDPVVELHAWQYQLELTSKGGTKKISVDCPAKWVVSYRSDYTLSEMLGGLAEAQAADPRRSQRFVMHALVMGEVLRSVPGIETLLSDLRLKLGSETSDQTGKMPFTTITSSIGSYLPPKELVQLTTQVSGVPRFTEIIDPDSVSQFADPVRQELLEMIPSGS